MHISFAQRKPNKISQLFFARKSCYFDHDLRCTEKAQRERRMQGFKSAGHAQRFLSAYGPIAQHFRPRRHRLSAAEYRHEMHTRFESWAEITGTKQAA
jgi:hypothetical protein